jgi:hypothetical protein
MNFYKKINTFLLERYPIFWNTNFVWISLLGILLHLLFWIFGYVETDIELLKDISADNYFAHSEYLFYYIITQISILIYFRFKYLNHHPFRNFYPLGKKYFWKLSAVLAFLLFIHSTVPLAFESGVKTKAMQLIDEEKEEQYAQIINSSFPFLCSDLTDYYITNRVYPDPFPLKEINDFYVGFDTVEDKEITHGIDHKEPYVSLNGNEYQFAITYDTTIDCEVHTYIRKIKDINKVAGISEFSILNFNRVFLSYARNHGFSYDSIAPKVHDIYLGKNKAAIQSNLQELKNICAAFQIDNNLDPIAITNLIFEQDLNKKQLIKTELRSSNRKSNASIDVAAESSQIAEANGGNDRMLMSLRNRNIEMFHGNFYADLHPIQNIYQNLFAFEDDGYTCFYENFAYYILAILGMVFFFIIIKHMEIVNLLMGLLYGFLLSTIFVVMNILMGNKSGDGFLISGIIYLLLFLFACLFLGFKKQKLSKRNNLRLFLPVSISMQMILPLIAYYIQDITKVIDPNPCNSEVLRINTFELGIWHLILNEFIAFACIFWYLRALHASKE